MAGESKSTERLVNVIVCVGAAVVIFGAWAKISAQDHLPTIYVDCWSVD